MESTSDKPVVPHQVPKVQNTILSVAIAALRMTNKYGSLESLKFDSMGLSFKIQIFFMLIGLVKSYRYAFKTRQLISSASLLSRRYMSSDTVELNISAERNKNYFDVVSNNDIDFGDYKTIASDRIINRQFNQVNLLGKENGPAIGDFVWLRGRINSVRAKGNACFLVLRSKSFYTVQALHFKDKENPDISKSLIKFAASIALESIVDIYGVVAPADVKSCSQNNVEIQIKKLYVVSRTPAALPFLLEDASRYRTFGS